MTLPGYEPYQPPVPEASWGFLGTMLVIVGFMFTAYFFVGATSPVTQVQGSKTADGHVESTRAYEKSLVKQLLSGILASISLGLGLLFVMLYAGIYV